MKNLKWAIAILVLTCVDAFSVAVVIDPPSGSLAAPGQVITFTVQGMGSGINEPQPVTNPPYPTSLAGISIDMVIDGSPIQVVPVPIRSIRRVSVFTCIDLIDPCLSSNLSIEVQMPYFQQFSSGTFQGVPASLIQVRFYENKVLVTRAYFQPVADRIHLLSESECVQLGCPISRHLDGTVVNSKNLPKSGEEYVIYAYGLGPVEGGLSQAGEAAISAVPVLNKMSISFNIGTNADSYKANDPSNGLRQPVSVSLVQGYVGLYQIKVILPQLPEDARDCGVPVTSNMNITVIGRTSFDSTKICVHDSTTLPVAPPLIQGLINFNTKQRCEVNLVSGCVLMVRQMDTIELYGQLFDRNRQNMVQLVNSAGSYWLYSGDGYYFGEGGTTRVNAQVPCSVASGNYTLYVWRNSQLPVSNGAPITVNGGGCA